MTVFIQTVMEYITCCHTGCGIQFGIEADYVKRLRQTHAWFYCPNGHHQHFPGETEAERLQRQLKQTEECLTYARQDVDRLKGRTKMQDRQIAARKGIITRMKRRLVAGRCVCCSKQFKDLETHMANRHPKFNPEKAAEALTEKASA